MWQGWIILIVGLWLLLGAGIMDVKVAKDGYEIGYLLSGIVAFVFGLWAFLQPLKGLLKIFSGIIGIAGIWLGLSAFISGLHGLANAVILGIILIVLGFWSAMVKQSAS